MWVGREPGASVPSHPPRPIVDTCASDLGAHSFANRSFAMSRTGLTSLPGGATANQVALAGKPLWLGHGSAMPDGTVLWPALPKRSYRMAPSQLALPISPTTQSGLACLSHTPPGLPSSSQPLSLQPPQAHAPHTGMSRSRAHGAGSGLAEEVSRLFQWRRAMLPDPAKTCFARVRRSMEGPIIARRCLLGPSCIVCAWPSARALAGRMPALVSGKPPGPEEPRKTIELVEVPLASVVALDAVVAGKWALTHMITSERVWLASVAELVESGATGKVRVVHMPPGANKAVEKDAAEMFRLVLYCDGDSGKHYVQASGSDEKVSDIQVWLSRHRRPLENRDGA